MVSVKRSNFKNKKKSVTKPIQKSRRELRKEKRQQKKINRALHYQNKKNIPGKYVLKPDKEDSELNVKDDTYDKEEDDRQQELEKKEKKQKKLAKEQRKHKRLQLKEDNLKEDKIIKQLEKRLKLNKRKSKTIPKTFVRDGLDYLLDFCDEENRSRAIETEKQLLDADTGTEFEEDLNLIIGENDSDDNQDKNDYSNDELEDDVEMEDKLVEDEDEDEDEVVKLNDKTSDRKKKNLLQKKRKYSSEDNFENDNTIEDELGVEEEEEEEDDDEEDEEEEEEEEEEGKNRDISEDENETILEINSHKNVQSKNDQISTDEEGYWEDIYGRKRDKQGNIVHSANKYVPPGARVMDLDSNTGNEKLCRLRKQLKGLLNRLAERNMQNIASQVEDLYMTNSRNNMNEILTKLIIESLVSPVMTPDRLICEHVMLIAILHANIGIEIGAQFLLTFVKKFVEMLDEPSDVENKELDNLILMISHLYNFKIYGHQLIYQILEKLVVKFSEKEIELILLVLKTVGFPLRKDNPVALKEFILSLQQKANETKSENSRIKFMLDILLAIKNNNVSKIPQYDPSHVEHLKKLIKSSIRKGNTVTQLNVSLDDLLHADERGKWWVVGSAWSNSDISKPVKNAESNKHIFSQKILELARKQRMNTDVRRNIFCILMTAEDYLDAFEKLHHLGLKDQQEREIIYVIIDCCLQEKKFNPYYAILAQKFCDYNRKCQMTIQYTLWDKLKELEDYNTKQLSNLAQFLTHLFIEKGLPFSVLKVIQFAELDKHTMRLLRQIMLGILLHENEEVCLEVFERISLSPQLQNFRESLRLFINHFLLKNIESSSIPQAEQTLLKKRTELIEKVLISRGGKVVF